MQLLYCYVDFTDPQTGTKKFRGLERFEINLSPTDNYHYDESSNTLFCSSRKTPLPKEFWRTGENTTNIYNINVIAGENGTGKTTIIHYLIDLLNYIYFDFGASLSKQDRLYRHNPSRYHNLLLLNTEDGLCTINLQPGGIIDKVFK